MSRIYFHQRDGDTIEIQGAERAYLGLFCQRFAHSLVGDHWIHLPQLEHPLMRFMDQRSRNYIITPIKELPRVTDYPKRFMQASRNFELMFTTLSDAMLTFNDETMPLMDAALNSVIATASPQLAFMAKVHGTCESHGWLDGADREYFAAVIHNARMHNVLRRDMGWEALYQALDEGVGPVVMSYSVTDGFPTQPARIEEEAWDSLEDDEQFDIALKELDPWLQMTEGNLTETGFMAGWSLFDIMDSAKWRAGSGLADKGQEPLDV